MGLPAHPLTSRTDVALARAERARGLASLRRRGWVLQGAVVAGWFGLACVLAAVLASIFHYGSVFGVAAVAMAMGGLLAPAAISAQRAIDQELSRRRLRLASAYRGNAEHLPPRLRELLMETRMVHSAVDVEGDWGPASRAIWDWMRQVDRLEERDRHLLDGLGLSTSAVREVVFRDTTGRLDQLRGGLTESQQVQLGRQLGKFEKTLGRARPLPYR